jgi:hypothetical protein
MCIVHRIVNDPTTGLRAAIRFEFAPKKGITLSTREIMRGAFSLGVTNLEANTSTTITLAKKPAARQVRRESLMERTRRLENARLTGSIPLPGIEEHRYSPQSHTVILKKYGDEDDLSGRYHGSGSGFRNAGRKPRNKHHRNHAVAW